MSKLSLYAIKELEKNDFSYTSFGFPAVLPGTEEGKAKALELIKLINTPVKIIKLEEVEDAVS